MAWIKRNLYFLAGTAIAAAMLGLAGYYCYSKWSLNKGNDDQLTTAYEDWKRIINQPVGPGNDKVDNIKIAREEQEKVRQMIQRLRSHFVHIQPIPNSANGTVSGLDFQRALSTTIGRMSREAANSGVKIQTNYYFSFQAERDQLNFEPGSLGPLSERLGHIRFICDVLFKAKINSLLSVRRERVSQYDNQSVTDYLDIPSVTNEFAVLVPYEVRFECFSAELGEALAGFGNVSNGIIVKAINIERSPDSAVAPTGSAQAEPTRYQYQVIQPQFAGQAPYAPNNPPTRYVPPRGSGYNPYQRGYSPYLQPQVPAPTPARPTTSNVLDERPLTVTLVLNVVKMLPKK